jgi:hypothetical protein
VTAKGRRGARGVGAAGLARGTTKGPRAHVWLGGRLCTRRPRLRVEQDRLGDRAGLILRNDNATVARKVQVDLGQRAIVGGPQRQRGGMEGIRLAVGVVEGARFGIEQVSRVRVFRGRIECRGR